ncbi:MAG: FtsX-like permease family protein [Actinobacteria bacterium]|nr:MAG: FtsX-like permease family protein [Actinomycetota bacterium]
MRRAGTGDRRHPSGDGAGPRQDRSSRPNHHRRGSGPHAPSEHAATLRLELERARRNAGRGSRPGASRPEVHRGGARERPARGRVDAGIDQRGDPERPVRRQRRDRNRERPGAPDARGRAHPAQRRRGRPRLGDDAASRRFPGRHGRRHLRSGVADDEDRRPRRAAGTRQLPGRRQDRPRGGSRAHPPDRAGARSRFRRVVVRAVPAGRDRRIVGGDTPTLSRVRRPSDVQNYERVRATPIALAAVLGLLALAAVAHVLGAAVRRRARDLAVLKTLGMIRRQVRSTVAWQASAVALVALSIGVPTGVAAGRWAWSAFATQLGTVAEPRVPAAVVAASIPLVLVACNVVAAFPGRRAAKTAPALVLRSE